MRKALIVCTCLYAPAATAELLFDIGANYSEIRSLFGDREDTVSRSGAGLHFGVGARRNIADRSDLSFRVEIDSVDSDLFLAVRAFDYRYHLSDKFALNAFFGAARLDLATPAYGYYLGGGWQWKEMTERWDLNVDFRYGDKVARDNLLPDDPQGGRPDNFHDVLSISVYLSYRF